MTLRALVLQRNAHQLASAIKQIRRFISQLENDVFENYLKRGAQPVVGARFLIDLATIHHNYHSIFCLVYFFFIIC